MSETSFLDPVLKRWGRRVHLSDHDISALAALPWSRKLYPRDAYIIREGEPAVVCTLLVAGFAYRQKLVTSGARQIISIHIPGEFLDLQHSLLEVADHNVQALTRVSVGVIPKVALLDVMGSNPNLRRALWLDSLIDASVFREWVVNVGRRDARGRIAHLLCELADRLRASGVSDGEMYDFPLTQEQIGDATGLTAVHTNRTLQSLRKDGLINLTSSRCRYSTGSGSPKSATSTSGTCTIRFDRCGAVRIARPLVELIGHSGEDQPDAFVDQAVREITAMFGLAPKLLWSGIHNTTTHPC